jgi:hypothetical protein
MKEDSTRFEIRWDPNLLKDLRELKALTGKAMGTIVQDSVKKHIKREKKRLAPLAKARAKLLPN